MEADLVAQRCALFWLSHRHPEWTYAELAAHVGRSESWVNKWLARLKHATTPDLKLFQSRSHARHTPSPSIPQPVVERILALRDEPPDHLRRVPGPRTLARVAPPRPGGARAGSAAAALQSHRLAGVTSLWAN